VVRLGNVLNNSITRLSGAGVPSPRMNAELLLMFVLGCDRAYLYGHPEHELSGDEISRYDEALVKRQEGIPAQYITGHQEFWGMDLIVSPAVLIPRPETEHVVEAVLERAGRRNPAGKGAFGTKQSSAAAPIKIVDVGTGSGCIALALAKELPEAEVHATEISSAALEIARANAARHQLDKRIQFHETDLLENMQRNAFDFVVSNPPYVGESEEDSVQLDVRKFEPRTAVFAGATGLEVIERLIPQANGALKPGGWLVMEISGSIAARVTHLLAHWSNVQLTNDLQGIARVVTARQPRA